MYHMGYSIGAISKTSTLGNKITNVFPVISPMGLPLYPNVHHDRFELTLMKFKFNMKLTLMKFNIV